MDLSKLRKAFGITLSNDIRSLSPEQLENEKNELLDGMRKMLDTADAEVRDFTGDEAEAFEEGEVRIKALEKELDERHRRQIVRQPPPISGTYRSDGHPAMSNSQRLVRHGTIGGDYDAVFGPVDTRDNTDADEFVRRVIAHAPEGRMVSNVGAQGGFSVPSYWVKEIYNAVVQDSFALSRCRVFSMEGKTLTIAAWDSEDQSSGFLGGVNPVWVAEAATQAPIQPQLREMTLSVNKVMFPTTASRELIEDGNVVSSLGEAMRYSIWQLIDEVVLTGDGVGKPLGLLNCPSTVVQSRTTANQIDFSDVSSSYARLHPIFLRGAVWHASPSTLPQLMTIQDAAGNYLWATNPFAGAAAAVPGALLGLPVIISDKSPSLGEKGDLTLCNWGSYNLGLRGELVLERSDSVYWTQDLVAFRVVMRIDGQPSLDSAVVPRNGGDTLSWAVVLDA